MAKTSIHIQPVKGGSEEHNKRLKELDYVRKDLTHLNKTWEGDSQANRLESIKERYKATTGQKLQKKATPIREGVVVTDGNVTMHNLFDFAEKLRSRFSIDCFQISLHADEGSWQEDGTWKPNLHAHMVFDWTDHESGKSIKLNRQQMAEIQTLCADCMEMERGVSSDVQHLSAIQFKEAKAKEELNKAKEEKEKAQLEAKKAEATRKEEERKASEAKAKAAKAEARAVGGVLVSGAKALVGKWNEGKKLEAAKAEGRTEAMLEVLKGAKMEYKDMSKVTPEKVGRDLAQMGKQNQEAAQGIVSDAKRQLRNLKAENEALQTRNKLLLSLPIIEKALEVLRSFVYHVFATFSTEDKKVLSQVLQGDEKRAKTLRDLGEAYGGIVSQGQYWSRWNEAEEEMRKIANGQSNDQGQTQGRGWGRGL